MKQAIIVVDMQKDYAEKGGRIDKWGLGVQNISKTIPKAKQFLDRARTRKIPIIHIQMTEAQSEIPENMLRKKTKDFGDKENWELCVPGTEGYKLLLHQEGEKIIKKKNYDAFSNPELHNYLQELGVKELIIIGGYTHTCVDTTVRSAFTKGYDVILVTDLVGSPDSLLELHNASLKILGMQFSYNLESEKIIFGGEK